MAQKRISDERFRELLLQHCNEGNEAAHSKTNFFQLLQTEYSIDKTRALRLHDTYYPEWTQLNRKGQEDATIQGVKTSVEKGIRTKTERILELQENADLLKKKIDEQYYSDPYELTALIKAHKDIQAEISKLEGDYAAKKIDIGTSKGVSKFLLGE